MKLTKTLTAIALAVLSHNAMASDDDHGEGEKLYKTHCAACHGATGGMDMNKRIAPPIAGVRMQYINAHPEKDAFIRAVSGWLASQDENKSLMPAAIKQFKIMPPLEIALEDSEKIAAYIYAGDIEKPQGFEKHVEDMHGTMSMGKGMHAKGHRMQAKGKGMHARGHQMQGQGMRGMNPGMRPPMGMMQPGYGMPPLQMRLMMMQQLGLSAEQRQKMQALMKEKGAVMQSLNQQQRQIKMKISGLDTATANYKDEIFSLADKQAEISRRMVVEMGETRFKMDALLSPEQRQNFSQMRASRRAMMQRMQQGRPQMRMGQMPQMPMPPMAMPGMAKPPMNPPVMNKAAPVTGPAPTAPGQSAPATNEAEKKSKS